MSLKYNCCKYLYMVPQTGFEPVRCCHRGIFLLLYVTIAASLRCSLDYVFTVSIKTQVVGVQSLHIYDIAIDLARRSPSHSPNQPTSTLKVSFQALSIFLSSRSKVPCVLPVSPLGQIDYIKYSRLFLFNYTVKLRLKLRLLLKSLFIFI